MTGRSDAEKATTDRVMGSGRLMFAAVLVFAVLATAALVFTDDAKWLKLAVIAALWAAFFGAMLSIKYRHHAVDRDNEVADLQSVYELELEREVAARREYELEVEAETRRRIAEEVREESREDIAALRAELHGLRENLERLTGGEVLVERIALRAQSTRMRTIGSPGPGARAIAADDEFPRSITAGADQPVAHPVDRANGRGVGAVLDPSTELMERAPSPQRPRPAQRIEVATPTQPGPRAGAAPQPVSVQRNGAAPARYRQAPAGTDRSGAVVADRSSDQRAAQPRPAPRPSGPDSSARLDRPHRHDEQTDNRLARPGSSSRSIPTRRDPAEDGSGQRRLDTGRIPVQSTGEHSRAGMRHVPANPPSTRPPAGPTGNGMAARAAGSADPAATPSRFTPKVNRSVLTPGAAFRAGAGTSEASSERSRWGAGSANRSPFEPESAAPYVDPTPVGTGTGGRRRAEEPADWTPEPADEPEWESSDERHGRHGGQHESGSYQPVVTEQSASDGYGLSGRAEPEPAGAHTAGRSVTELLAAHASGDDGPRRHRRRAD